ncbi:MAG: 50S ribosomal protein L31 [Candidatus Moranbacteria bacterium]|nr:50S ribosomal protein L31 [Candidatus Moranbacteria bacterium]
MKSSIHPKYFEKAEITCACGAVLTVGSTVEKMSIEICSNCHPFYTGKKKTIDSTGRVDRFKKLSQKAQALKTTKPATSKKEKIAARKEKQAIEK